MKFRTEITPQQGMVWLSPADPVVMLGSCFSDNLSARMRRCLWRAENPLGVLYNPLSIAKALNLMLCDIGLREQLETTIFHSYGVYHSWLVDSGASSPEKRLTLDVLTAMSARLHYLLERSKALFITFGTASLWHIADDPANVVGNCHKQPLITFGKRRAGVEEITAEWDQLIPRLQEDYPELQIIFTVSPVRYVKEGFTENSRSKATLLMAIEKLCRRHTHCHYFPAYEIFMDDLRDYRFYAADLVHPSPEGIDYVWEIFQETFLDEEGMNMLHAGRDIVNRYFHRPNIPIRTPAQEENMYKCREDILELSYNPFHEAYPETYTLEELQREFKG